MPTTRCISSAWAGPPPRERTSASASPSLSTTSPGPPRRSSEPPSTPLRQRPRRPRTGTSRARSPSRPARTAAFTCFALSGAVVSPSQPVAPGQEPGAALFQEESSSSEDSGSQNEPEQAGQGSSVFGSCGLGISGDGVYNGFTDTTEAYINDPGTFATAGLTVGALDDTELIAAAGAFTLSSNAPNNGSAGKNGAV